MRGIGTPSAHIKMAGRTFPARLDHDRYDFSSEHESARASRGCRAGARGKRVDMTSTFLTEGRGESSVNARSAPASSLLNRSHRAVAGAETVAHFDHEFP